SESLLPLVGDKAQLQQYAAATPIVDMVRFSPAQNDPQLVKELVELLWLKATSR
ncbi:sulfite reductase subunit alpha, partial [Klebsiella pneumoniae]